MVSQRDRLLSFVLWANQRGGISVTAYYYPVWNSALGFGLAQEFLTQIYPRLSGRVYNRPVTREKGRQMDIRKTPAYRKAFNAYLRRGIPLHLSLKAVEDEHPTAQYIWRTQGDGKVRSSHAANNGRIFSWDDPPATGHPGEDYGCRCTAEPYVPDVSEYAYQTLTSSISDGPRQWTDEDFLYHFYYGNGAGLTLSETGHLAGVIDYYFYQLTKEGMNIYSRINSQIVAQARKHEGYFTYQFDDSYQFRPYLYAFGYGAVRGFFTGSSRRSNGQIMVEGEVSYLYTDRFTDPASIREKITTGTSDPAASNPIWVRITDGIGIYFDIVDRWTTYFQAVIHAAESRSIYKWE